MMKPFHICRKLFHLYESLKEAHEKDLEYNEELDNLEKAMRAYMRRYNIELEQVMR